MTTDITEFKKNKRNKQICVNRKLIILRNYNIMTIQEEIENK